MELARHIAKAAVLVWASNAAMTATANSESTPRPTDDRVTIELFAENPQIVTPTGITVDRLGRVFVAESHTHFRPDDYDGPQADRILVFEDTDQDGRADRRHLFHEGFTHVMDIEFHQDGSLYVATRMDIHRLRDTDGDLQADEVTPIVKMDTTGTYPHNGLSGLAFDFEGDLNFGLGENLGHSYTLIGTDGTRLRGGGEGGSTYHVHADGTQLRRVTTGWWNPFGMCVDTFGRVFGTDNDPSASPPCRLIQIVENGDYGYQYRYGRTGLHPLISWTGEMPGTLPMRAGTGEAPCAIIAYESTALPKQYRGNLLVASWADHRIEHYPISDQASEGLVRVNRKTLVHGGNEFRPVGLAIAPDGSVFISDWVSSSYELHKQGRIWRLRQKSAVAPDRSTSARQALQSEDRTIREAAARQLANSRSGRQFLRRQLTESGDPRVRSAALQSLAAIDDFTAISEDFVRNEPHLANQVLAVRALLEHGADPRRWAARQRPTPVRAEALRHLDLNRDLPLVLEALEQPDRRLFHEAIEALRLHLTGNMSAFDDLVTRHPLGTLLAMRRIPNSHQYVAHDRLASFLLADDLDVRFATIKWIADQQLKQYRGDLEALLSHDDLDIRSLLAATSAIDHLDGNKPSDRPSPELLLNKLKDDSVPGGIRRLALRLIDPSSPELQINLLTRLLDDPDAATRQEAIRTLSKHPDESRFGTLAKVAQDRNEPTAVRADAILGLAAEAERFQELLAELACSQDTTVRDEALRALYGVELRPSLRESLLRPSAPDPNVDEALQRIVSKTPLSRPAANDTDAWIKLLDQDGDVASGERIFFGERVGTCSRCHEIDGRGTAVGPDLSTMTRRLESKGTESGLRWLLETVLQPSREMAPQYTTWLIVTTDGRTLTGLPRRKGGKAEAYLGKDGKEFSLRKEEIELHREATTSLMPDNLLANLTRQELCDLVAFLTEPDAPGQAVTGP